jgi:hypothetical protein
MGCATNMMKFYAEKDMKHHTPYIDSFEVSKQAVLIMCQRNCFRSLVAKSQNDSLVYSMITLVVEVLQQMLGGHESH